MGGLKNADHITTALLQWGSGELRDLPWRRASDPWPILVSEVMLQQTSVARVQEKYELFVAAFPTAQTLAQAPLGRALELWQGLGYPRRCRNLRAAATVISEQHGGNVPDELDDLLALPGVGPYTARAVLAFAFRREVGVVDVNVSRVFSRIQGKSLTAGALQQMADSLVPQQLSWEWNQVLMELGGRVCVARSPKCTECPVYRWCAYGSRPEDAGKDDPARLSAGVSKPQPKFKGSDRQLRGQVLKLVLQDEQPLDFVIAGMGMQHDQDRAHHIINSLVNEGLVCRRGDVLVAP